MPSTQYLFLFTIGPVQSFIAQARKTRDLYAGSSILGDIIQAAMDEAKFSGDIIVPDFKLKAKPNRFLARINRSDPQVFGKEIETAARAKWVDIALKSFNAVGVCSVPITNGFNTAQKLKFDREALTNVKPSETAAQINDFLEIYWVALPYDQSKDNYQHKYDELQQRLAAIKNTRQFNQIHEQAARKCSLDGERNALFYRKREIGDAKDLKPTFIQSDANPLDGEATIKLLPGEGLSAVSLAKRFYKPEVVFSSTAEIALMHSLGKISASEDKYVLQEYEGIFGRLFDEQLYYEENLTENYFKKNGIKASRLQPAKEAHKKIISAFKKSKVHFQKYYAILAFDGDSMGEVWSGSLLKKKDDCNFLQEEMSSQLQQFQQVLASRLGIYAAYASAYLNGELSILEDDTYRKYRKTVTDRRISVAGEVESDQQYKTRMSLLETPKGKAVYAGGDDFLGFVNLQYLFEVMKELREAYDALVSEPVRSKFALQKSLSFSAGVAIAHYKIPLNEVLRKAHEMEKKAKEIDDEKDAFSIAVMKHSGTIEEVHFKWKINGEKWMTDELSHIVRELCVQHFSNTFITALYREFVRLQDAQGNFCHQEYVRFEIHRLLKRANTLLPHGRETAALFKQRKKQAIEKLENAVYNVYSEAFEYDPVSCMRVPDVYSFSTFLSALTICDFIKRKTIYEHN